MAVETIVAAVLIVAMVALMGYAFSGGDEKKGEPQLFSISPALEAASLRAIAEGRDFGDIQGIGAVYIGGEYADVEAWSDTSITCRITPYFWDAENEVVVRTEAGFSSRLQLEAGKVPVGTGQGIPAHS